MLAPTGGFAKSNIKYINDNLCATRCMARSLVWLTLSPRDAQESGRVSKPENYSLKVSIWVSIHELVNDGVAELAAPPGLRV